MRMKEPRFKPPKSERTRPSLPASDRQRAPTMSPQAGEALGLKALLFIVEDEARLTRFLADTGLDPEHLKSQAGEPAMLAAVLGHLLDDESLLLVFAAGAGTEPVDVQAARLALGGQSPWDSV